MSETTLPKIRLLLVDDHFVVRLGIATALSAAPDFEVVGQAGSGAQALELYLRLRPDVVLMDVVMPGQDGIDTGAAICAADPRARIIMLTVNVDGETAHRAVRAGAAGFLSKNVEPEELFEAVREVNRGRTYFPSIIRRRLEVRGQQPELTEREREVLALMVAGRSNKEIGSALHLAEPTVKYHVGGILRKLDAKDRTQAVIQAIARGIVKP
jgi:two-component system NarL family response regulator